MSELPTLAEPTERHVGHVSTLISEVLGLDVDVIRPEIRSSAIIARAARMRRDVEGYVDGLEAQPSELAALARLLTGLDHDAELTPGAARALARTVRKPTRDAPLRVWVVGCGEGRDVHRLGLEILAHHGCDPGLLTFFGTDLDEGCIAEAGRGRLDRAFVDSLSPQCRSHLVEVETETFVPKVRLRGRVAFAHHDLLKTPPFGRIDLIVCHSMLRMLNPDARAVALGRLAFSLRADGLLVVGPRTNADVLEPVFEVVDPQRRYYRRSEKVPRTPFPVSTVRETLGGEPRGRVFESALGVWAQEQSEAAILVDAQGTVQHVISTGDGLVSRTTSWTPLAARIDRRLEVPIASAVRDCRARDLPVRRELLPLSDGRLVNLSCAPIDGCELILVRVRLRPNLASTDASEADARVRQLEEELGRVRADLEEAVSALEVSNHQLASANRELVASNDELNYANQQLHSRNRELEVTNDRLDHRLQLFESLGSEVDTLFDNSAVAAVFLGPEGTVWRASPAVVELTGIEPLLGRPLSPAAFGREVLEALESVLQGGPAFELERAHRGRHLLIRGLARDLPQGAGRGAVLTLTDLSAVWQETRDEEAMARQLADLFETSGDATVECCEDGTVTYANRAARELFGLAEASGGGLLGILEEVVPSELEAIRDAIASARHGAHRARVEMYWPRTGQIFDVTARPIHDKGRVVRVVITARDISELYASQNAVRQSQALLQTVLDSLRSAIAVVAPDGALVMSNRAWGEGRALGFPGAALGDGESYFARLQAESASGREEAGLVLQYLDSVVQGREDLEPSRYWLSVGEAPRFLATRAMCLAHRGRQLTIVIHEDETSAKMAEKLRLEIKAKVLDAVKLESLGVLAGGVAHDFNNLLVGILSNATFLFDKVDDDLQKECLHDVEIAAERAAELCQQLLAFSGRGQFQIEQIRMDRILLESGRLLQASISRSISLQLDVPEFEVPPVEVDVSQFRQVLFNLVTNGAEAIPEGPGRVEVKIVADSLDGGRIAASVHGEGAVAGRYVGLKVRDSGCGMSEAVRRRIFEPFYSTKFTGRGLGLAAVQGIVSGHGGVLEVESEEGMGTVMTAWFPEAAPSPEVAKERTVLVVDDEEVVRSAARRSLENEGFRVLEVADGPSAVALMASGEEKIHLVLLDISMPEMTGDVVYLHIRKTSSVPVLFSSGLPELADRSLLAPEENTYFIQKPYKTCALVDTVRDIVFADEYDRR